MSADRFDVGGVLLDRPFRIRRLGHIGLNVDGAADALAFYCDLLGFRIADRMDFAPMLPAEWLDDLSETHGFFLHHGSDHHSLVVFPKGVTDKIDRDPAEVTLNQLTWQVGSLEQVVDAQRWLGETDVRIFRSGRDMPGSNWHVYFADPDGHVNELYYGMEQIGWDGLSKPTEMHERVFHQAPDLPQICELEEVERALESGVDLTSGTRAAERQPAVHAVEGVLLPRPFKVTRLGPIGLFVADPSASLAFYESRLGFALSESVDTPHGACHYLRAGTEHHSLAIVPRALRAALGLSEHTTTGWVGLQLGSYRQLHDAISFLANNGVRLEETPVQLLPGVEHSVFAFDPAGHAFLLYFAMEQIGWDGQPRPVHLRPDLSRPWPATIRGEQSSHFVGETFLGPWG